LPDKNLQIVLATLPDAAAIRDTLEQARAWMASLGENHWPVPFQLEWIEQKVRAGEFWVVRLNGQIAGEFRLIHYDPDFWGEDDGDCLYFHTFAVRREFAGQKLGSQVLDWVKGYALSLGKRYIRLDTPAENPQLNTYYKNAAFTDVAQVLLRGIEWTLFQFELGAEA
jgi:GNAT superfamily N-acetyltransferase